MTAAPVCSHGGVNSHGRWPRRSPGCAKDHEATLPYKIRCADGKPSRSSHLAQRASHDAYQE